MIKIFIPSGARDIISALEKRGHDAYIVGGCVRDALLGRVAGDYDITTSARPEEIKAIFDKTVDTGIAHGTVTVISSGEPYEVTTYRIDGEYKDMRHPDSIVFTDRIEDDLSRRDFTVNAMAYNDKNGLKDAFCGKEDLDKKIIRAVGDARTRFLEDALRILRGIRFASVLGFSIEKKTSEAICELAPNLESVSAERIFVEWKKLLAGISAYKIINDYFDVIKIFLPELKCVSLSEEAFLKIPPEFRFAALFLNNGGADAYISAASRLKTDNATKEDGAAILRALENPLENNPQAVKRYLIGKSDRISVAAARVGEATGIFSDGILKNVCDLIDADFPRTVAHLKIGGRELIELGMRGAEIGRTLERLLFEVSDGIVENEKESLINSAKRFIDKESC